MSQTEDHLVPGENCWRIERAGRAAVIVDAADFFAHARAAMLKARRRIMLIGWDFDARIMLTSEPRLPGEPDTLGAFITWLVRREPALEIYLLRWDKGALRTLLRGTTLLTLIGWWAKRRIHTRLDGFHPTGASHHQKIVVIDDCIAFCGGIDMTAERWDTRCHRPGDPGRRRPDGKPYKPWHDATTAVDGPAAAALAELARDRWTHAGGREIAAVAAIRDCWPEGLEPHFRDAPVAIVRTRAEMPGCPPIHEVERLFLDQIARARRHIYVESQYFASRRIAEAIARRLDEPDGPEVVIVNPVKAQGWLEPLAMDSARARLMAALGRRDTHRRLRLYHPTTAAGEPIYCHAKIMVVDDAILRVGSSNMNNRSLRLDTECDLAIDTALAPDAAGTIAAIRDGLIAEHLGVEPAAVTARIAETGSLIAAIEALRGDGRSLVPYELPDLNAVQTWLADNEVLDPEGPGEMFEALSKRGLFKRLARPG